MRKRIGMRFLSAVIFVALVFACVSCGEHEPITATVSYDVIGENQGPKQFDPITTDYCWDMDALYETYERKCISEGVYRDIYDGDESDNGVLHTYYFCPIRMEDYYAEEYESFTYASRHSSYDNRQSFYDEWLASEDVAWLYCEKTVEEWGLFKDKFFLIFGNKGLDSTVVATLRSDISSCYSNASWHRDRMLEALFTKDTGLTFEIVMSNDYYCARLSDDMLEELLNRETPMFFLCTENEYYNFYYYEKRFMIPAT